MSRDALLRNTPLLVPADVHDGAGVIRCNPERDQLMSQLSEWVDSGVCDASNLVDGANETAAETAERLTSSGVTRVTLVVPPRDGRAGEILGAACRDRGLDVEVVRTGPSGRLSDGTDGSVQACAEDELLLSMESLECRVATATRVPIRGLVPPPLDAIPASCARRSPLPPGVSWSELMPLILQVVESEFRPALGHLRSILIAHELGMNAVEDQYAGLGLYEHNADLLVNIVESESGAT